MFGKLKEKLKNWFVSSKEKIEDKTESSESEDFEEETKKIERDVIETEKIYGKVDNLIELAKKEPAEIVPTKLDYRKTELDLEKIQERSDSLKKELEQAKNEEKESEEFEDELERVNKLIESGKDKKIQKVPLKFETGKQKYEPDLEKIKGKVEEIEGIEEEIKEIKKEIKEIEEEKGKKSFFSRLKSKFIYKLTDEDFNDIFEDLENLLLENNVALEAVDYIKSKLAENLIGKEIKKDEIVNEIRKELKKVLNEILIEPDNPLEFVRVAKKPFKILFFGVNGTGKTTSIAKIAYFLKNSGFSVVLAAGDTFRAASIEQILDHGKKLGVPVIKQDYGSDPAAVGFDAIKYAEKHKIDVVLIDTAGRMHTKDNLLKEMEKIVRVTKPNLKLFVAESIAGNDAVEQARTFHEKIGIDGSVLSKVDIDEKGGTIISVSYATKKPIFYLGTGQKFGNLELFNRDNFILGLLG